MKKTGTYPFDSLEWREALLCQDRKAGKEHSLAGW